MNVASIVERGRRRHPDHPAIVFEGRTLTYGELAAATDAFAEQLSAHGVAAGDRVAMLLPNVPEFAVAYYAILRLGAIAVSLAACLREEEIRALVADCGAKAIVELDGSLAVRRTDAPSEPVSGFARAAAILYTSGTTGFPKGATLSHRNVLFVARAKQRHLGITPRDRLLLFLPLSHCFGQNAVMNAALAAGATIVLHRTFDAGAVLDSIARDGVTMFFGVPTSYVLLLEHAAREQLAGIRLFFSAAAPLPADVEAKWEQRFGSAIHQGYGLTESSPFAAYDGTPVRGVEMRVVDPETHQPLPAGEAGEIVVRGPNVMLGYWGRPDETAAAIRDGWLRTGDLGRMTADGCFTVEDRIKDMIAVGGYKTWPAEVERVLQMHPAVREAAVYGVPDPVMGERVHAAVVAMDGATDITPAELIAWCRARLADFKVPGEIALVQELPRSRTGKVLKRVLRDEHARAARPPLLLPAASQRDLERRITTWLASRLAVERVEPDRTFTDHGLDSVAAVELAATLGNWLGREVSPLVMWQFSTASSLARHLGSPA